MRMTHPPLSPKSLGFSLLGLFFALFSQSIAEKTLKASIIIFRHGDRTPFGSYPKELYRENDWPQGYGQLTKLGIKQQYELGQYLRKRYAHFLSVEYKREEIFVLSSPYDRTIMSAQATLAGLFPPTGGQIWNPKIHWQPIPVHLTEKDTDHIHFPIVGCPRYDRIQNETIQSKALKKVLQPYMNLLSTLAEKTGYDMASLINLTNWKTWGIHDNLMVEITHHYPIPSWATPDVLAKTEELSDLTVLSMFGVYKKKEKSLLQGGVIVKKVLQELMKATKHDNKRKLTVYSGHTTTIAAFQIALNIYNGKMPPLSSCQFIELYEDVNGQYTIEMYYRNDTSGHLHQLTLPGCTFTCPLAKFTQLVSPVIVEDWAKKCEKYDKSHKGSPMPAQK